MTFRKLTFNFESEEDIDFYLEFLLTAGLKYVRLHKQLQADFENEKNKPVPRPEIPAMTLEHAKNMLRMDGYVFYKYKKPTAALKQRRHRRTKAEIENAGKAIRNRNEKS